MIDRKVKCMRFSELKSEEKYKLLDVLNEIVVIDQSKQTVLNAVKIYCRSVFEALNEADLSKIRFYQNEL